MAERRADPVHQKIASFLLPVALAMCAYLGNNAFQRIQDQLTRIEIKQSADQATTNEIKSRLYVLENTTSRYDEKFKLQSQR